MAANERSGRLTAGGAWGSVWFVAVSPEKRTPLTRVARASTLLWPREEECRWRRLRRGWSEFRRASIRGGAPWGAGSTGGRGGCGPRGRRGDRWLAAPGDWAVGNQMAASHEGSFPSAFPSWVSERDSAEGRGGLAAKVHRGCGTSTAASRGLIRLSGCAPGAVQVRGDESEDCSIFRLRLLRLGTIRAWNGCGAGPEAKQPRFRLPQGVGGNEERTSD